MTIYKVIFKRGQINETGFLLEDINALVMIDATKNLLPISAKGIEIVRKEPASNEWLEKSQPILEEIIKRNELLNLGFKSVCDEAGLNAEQPNDSWTRVTLEVNKIQYFVVNEKLEALARQKMVKNVSWDAKYSNPPKFRFDCRESVKEQVYALENLDPCESYKEYMIPNCSNLGF